jgi:hypothetical protein
MRIPLAWTLALLPLATSGCQPGDCPGGVPDGVAGIILHLPPESTVTPPETLVVSSPVQLTATLPPAPATGWTWLQWTAGNALSASATLAREDTGARVLSIEWEFEDGDPDAPPNDQFDATVTDTTGKVTGQIMMTGQYTWNPPVTGTCGWLGSWDGPTVTDNGYLD